MNRCIQKSKRFNAELQSRFDFIIDDLVLTAPTITLVCFIAVAFSYILIILFRHCAHYAVWGITFACLSLMIAIAGMYWFQYLSADTNQKFGIDKPIITTFLAGVSVVVVICVRKRIKLVIQLFKETAKVLLDIPALMAQPIMTFIATALAVAPFIVFQMLIETSGTMEMNPITSKVTFQQNGLIMTARILNIIGFVWFTQFLIGCQHFIIAGSVSKWYFTRDKARLNAPMKTTYYNLFWFHLGSICLGSWIITIIKTIRISMRVMYWIASSSQNDVLRIIAFLIDWLIGQLDVFLRYLIRSAYIIVAKDGLPFYEAASKSNNLIFNNLIDVLALNHVGDLVLSMGRLLVVAIAGFYGYEAMVSEMFIEILYFNPLIFQNGHPGITSIYFPMIVAIILSFIIVHCLLTIFEMTVDTIFLCYCEDVQTNDGSAFKPYFMSLGLKNVMEEMKKFGVDTKKQGTNNDKAPITKNEVQQSRA